MNCPCCSSTTAESTVVNIELIDPSGSGKQIAVEDVPMVYCRDCDSVYETPEGMELVRQALGAGALSTSHDDEGRLVVQPIPVQ